MESTSTPTELNADCVVLTHTNSVGDGAQYYALLCLNAVPHLDELRGLVDALPLVDFSQEWSDLQRKIEQRWNLTIKTLTANSMAYGAGGGDRDELSILHTVRDEAKSAGTLVATAKTLV